MVDVEEVDLACPVKCVAYFTRVDMIEIAKEKKIFIINNMRL